MDGPWNMILESWETELRQRRFFFFFFVISKTKTLSTLNWFKLETVKGQY